MGSSSLKSSGGKGIVIGQEDELPCGGPPPDLDPALQRARKAVRELLRVFCLKALQQLDGRSIRLVLKPPEHTWPHGLERIFARSPVAGRLRLGLVCRPHLSLVPRSTEALQKRIQVGVAVGNDMQALSRSKAGELMLGGADLIQKPQRVEARRDGAQALLRVLWNGGRCKEARTGGSRVRGSACSRAPPRASFRRA